MQKPARSLQPTGTIASLRSFSEKAARFLRDEAGPTAVQYAMLSMLILAGLLLAISALGLATADSFDSSGDAIESSFQPDSL